MAKPYAILSAACQTHTRTRARHTHAHTHTRTHTHTANKGLMRGRPGAAIAPEHHETGTEASRGGRDHSSKDGREQRSEGDEQGRSVGGREIGREGERDGNFKGGTMRRTLASIQCTKQHTARPLPLRLW